MKSDLKSFAQAPIFFLERFQPERDPPCRAATRVCKGGAAGMTSQSVTSGIGLEFGLPKVLLQVLQTDSRLESRCEHARIFRPARRHLPDARGSLANPPRRGQSH